MKVNKILYEAYNRVVNEDDDTQNQSSYAPIDIHPRIVGGKYYLYVSITDKSKFAMMGNFVTDMVGIYNKIREKKQMPPLSKEEINALRNRFWSGTDNKGFNDNTNEVDVRVSVDDPSTLFDKDGNINTSSKDYGRIKKMMMWVKNRLGIEPQFFSEELVRGVKSMYYAAKNEYTDEKGKEIDNETEQLFFKICDEIGRPETLKMLQSIHILQGDYVIDHQYSPKNILKIMAQATAYDRDGANQVGTISYLATERQWASMGREISDYSFPYHTVTRNAGRVNIDAGADYLQSQGKSALSMNEDNYSQQTKRAITANSNTHLNGNRKVSYSYNAPLYDVQATKVINGAVDKFTEEFGMKNNLTGELNHVTAQKINGITDIPQEDENERTNKLNAALNTSDYANVDITYKAVYNVASSIKGVNLTNMGLVDGDDDSQKIRKTTEMIHSILTEKLPKDSRILRDDNYKPLINIGVIIIMSYIGLPMNNAPSIQGINQDITKALYKPVYSITNSILRQKKALMNSKHSDSITETINIFSQLFIFEETFNDKVKKINENADL